MKKEWLKSYLTKKIPVVLDSFSISQVRKYLQANIKNFKDTNYVYVIDKSKYFVGIIPLREVYISSPTELVSKLCEKFSRVFMYSTDRKNLAAYLSLKYDLSNIAVVDNSQKLMGAIVDTDILRIFHESNIESRFYRSGISKVHASMGPKINIFKSFQHRFLWLFIGLFGGILAAKIIDFFSGLLSSHIILASFIPLVVYIADAVGTQLEAFSIRDLALFKNINFTNYFFRQLGVVLILSTFLGVSVGIISFFLYAQIHLSFALSIAVFVACISSIITGLLVPFLFTFFKSDPANGSGPLGTILQDILSVLIYFLVALAVL